jgi:hypothetical protein
MVYVVLLEHVSDAISEQLLATDTQEHVSDPFAKKNVSDSKWERNETRVKTDHEDCAGSFTSEHLSKSLFFFERKHLSKSNHAS